MYPNLYKFNRYRRKKILITGHTGFKGSWLAYLLNIFGDVKMVKKYFSSNVCDIFFCFYLYNFINFKFYIIKNYDAKI